MPITKKKEAAKSNIRFIGFLLIVKVWLRGDNTELRHPIVLQTNL